MLNRASNRHLLQQNRRRPINQELSTGWLIARNRRESAIIEINQTHPLNRASAIQLSKGWGGCPPSVLHAIALIEVGLDRQLAARLGSSTGGDTGGGGAVGPDDDDAPGDVVSDTLP